jgi:non-heme chloroperoxidase
LIYLDAAYTYAFDYDGSIEKRSKGFKLETKARASGEASASSSKEESVPQIINPLPPGSVMPEAEMRQQLIISPDGRIIGSRASEETRRASQAIMQGHRSYKNIPVKCLAIFADYSSLEPWKKEAGLEVQAQTAKDKSDMPKQMAAFEKGVPGARVVRLPRSYHYVFLSNEEEVLKEMHDFLESLPLE